MCLSQWQRISLQTGTLLIDNCLLCIYNIIMMPIRTLHKSIELLARSCYPQTHSRANITRHLNGEIQSHRKFDSRMSFKKLRCLHVLQVPPTQILKRNQIKKSQKRKLSRTSVGILPSAQYFRHTRHHISHPCITRLSFFSSSFKTRKKEVI